MFNTRRGWVLVSIAVVMALSGCCSLCRTRTDPTSTPTPTRARTSSTFDREATFSGANASVIFAAGTEVKPPADRFTLRPENQPPPSKDHDIITAVDIRPDNHTFRPPVLLRVDIPDYDRGGYYDGQHLDILQLNRSTQAWYLAGQATVIAAERAAEGEIEHTSVFALARPVEQVEVVPSGNTLVQFEDGEALPSLATSWDVSSDGQLWTFYLVEGLEMESGDIFTSEVVRKVFTLNGRTTIDGYRNAILVDDFTIQIELLQPNPNFLQQVAKIELPR